MKNSLVLLHVESRSISQSLGLYFNARTISFLILHAKKLAENNIGVQRSKISLHHTHKEGNTDKNKTSSERSQNYLFLDLLLSPDSNSAAWGSERKASPSLVSTPLRWERGTGALPAYLYKTNLALNRTRGTQEWKWSSQPLNPGPWCHRLQCVAVPFIKRSLATGSYFPLLPSATGSPFLWSNLLPLIFSLPLLVASLHLFILVSTLSLSLNSPFLPWCLSLWSIYGKHSYPLSAFVLLGCPSQALLVPSHRIGSPALWSAQQPLSAPAPNWIYHCAYGWPELYTVFLIGSHHQIRHRNSISRRGMGHIFRSYS